MAELYGGLLGESRSNSPRKLHTRLRTTFYFTMTVPFITSFSCGTQVYL